MERIKSFKEQISSFEKLSILQARDLYIRAIGLKNEVLKKMYMDKIILGTLHVVYNFIERNNLELLQSSCYDLDDFMSALTEAWIKKINEGELLNVDNYSFIFTPAFFNEVYDSLGGRTINISSQFNIALPEFSELFYFYVKLKNEGKKIEFNQLAKQVNNNDSLLRLSAQYQNKLLSIFNKMYNCLNFDKSQDLVLSKHKIAIFIRLLIDNGLNNTILKQPLNNTMEDNIINEMTTKDFVNTVDQILANDKTRYIIHQRFGLDGDDSQTLEDIGKYYGVSRESIRQMEKRALTRLANSSKLDDYNVR